MTIKQSPKIIVIVGPTASGKSDLAIQLARKFSAKGGPASGWNGAEIVSADSRQVYREMDIGTGKVTKTEQKLAKHHLIDIRDPNHNYTAANYKRDAIRAIKEILSAGKLPILAGGTGLYIQTVIENLNIPNVKPNPKLRKKLENYLAKKGLAALFQKLIALDPEAAYIVDDKNPRRVIRALEVAMTTGRPFSSQRTKGRPMFQTLEIGIALPNEILRRRINKRVDKMIKQELVKEVSDLIKKYGAAMQAFDAIGYREIIRYLKKELTLKEAAELIKTNTWRYAKRQMTWFKKDKKVRWIKNRKEAEGLTRGFLF